MNQKGQLKTKKELGAELNRLLRARHSELKRAAEIVGIRYQTLRQDLWQNRFLLTDLVRLCNEVGLPSDTTKLQENFEFQLKKGARGLRKVERELQSKVATGSGSLADVFSTLNERMSHVRDFVESAREIIPQIFQCLAPDDTIIIFISDEFPTHWGRDIAGQWLKPLAQKLKNGTRVIYLHPSNDLYHAVTRSGFHMLLTPDQVKARFNQFQRELANVLAESENKLVENLCCIEHDCPFVSTPQHRYVLYLLSDRGQACRQATCTFPIALNQGELEHAAEYLVMPLNRRFLGVLQDAAIVAIQNHYDKIHPEADDAKRRIAELLRIVSQH